MCTKFRTDTYKNSPLISEIRVWNQLKSPVKMPPTFGAMNSFKHALKALLSVDDVLVNFGGFRAKVTIFGGGGEFERKREFEVFDGVLFPFCHYS